MSPLLNRHSPCFVIPGLTRNPGFPVKTGTQFYTFLVPCLPPYQVRGWIPAFAGMTLCLVNYGLLSNFLSLHPPSFKVCVTSIVFTKLGKVMILQYFNPINSVTLYQINHLT
jgi:hypothetical protein